MAPSRIDDDAPPSFTTSDDNAPYTGPPRNVDSINNLNFPASLKPKTYHIAGTHPESKLLFTDVSILDSTGRDAYHGDVLVEGERISKVGIVPDVEKFRSDPRIRVFNGRGRTLMSGLGDAHTHFTWNGSDLARLGDIGVEEHVLLTAKSAQCYLDSGYTL